MLSVSISVVNVVFRLCLEYTGTNIPELSNKMVHG